MRGGEGLPHESDSYQDDTRTHGQEEAPPQKASNFVCTPLWKNKEVEDKVTAHAQ